MTYDIADTDMDGAVRLRRIAEVCSAYGQRVQLSVFECRVSPTRFARLVGEIQDVIDAEKDSVMIYRFPGDIAESRSVLGRRAVRDLGNPWIL